MIDILPTPGPDLASLSRRATSARVKCELRSRAKLSWIIGIFSPNYSSMPPMPSNAMTAQAAEKNRPQRRKQSRHDAGSICMFTKLKLVTGTKVSEILREHILRGSYSAYLATTCCDLSQPGTEILQCPLKFSEVRVELIGRYAA